MSWIFGILHRNSLERDISSFLPQNTRALHQIRLPELSIIAGGLQETCLTGTLTEPDKGWLVVGLGITLRDDHVEFLSAEAWQRKLSEATPDLRSLDGHFVALRWSQGKLECFTDQLGQRELYYAEGEGTIAFSTRLDWLTRLLPRPELNLEALSSRWLTFNQLSYRSPVRGIERLGPGGRGEFTASSRKATHVPWSPEPESGRNHRSLLRLLQAFVRPTILANKTISLGLSGGIDSRVILSLLSSSAQQSFSTHTFGHPNDPDVRVSEQIARKLHLECLCFYEPVPPVEECIAMARSFVSQTDLIEPASSVLKLRYYPGLHARNKLMLDGGFGEIHRRQYLNRLLRLGKRYMRNGDARAIFSLMRVMRADIFSRDVDDEFVRGCEHQIAELWETMPRIAQVGEENFADLVAIRTRFPNYGGPEQARLDGEVVNYMPFVQPSLLRCMLATPVPERRSGKAYRRIISLLRPELTEFPLVKSGTTYPFNISTTAAWGLTKLKTRMGLRYVDPTLHEFLQQISEFVQDLAHAQVVRTFWAYDAARIHKLVEEYYAGNAGLASQVDWWLTFEVWRQALHHEPG